jgi:hypothetical protein
MKLWFSGGSEIVYLEIDRKTKKLKGKSSQSNYNLVDLPFSWLFDKRKEKAQELICDRLTNKDFVKVITLSMANQGYKLDKFKWDEGEKENDKPRESSK